MPPPTCDPLTICHHAAFCVGFVEAFKDSSELLEAVIAVPTDEEGLAALRTAQEQATPEMLARRMAPFLDALTIPYLLDDALPGAAATLVPGSGTATKPPRAAAATPTDHVPAVPTKPSELAAAGAGAEVPAAADEAIDGMVQVEVKRESQRKSVASSVLCPIS